VGETCFKYSAYIVHKDVELYVIQNIMILWDAG
jgi:hypothetical protein